MNLFRKEKKKTTTGDLKERTSKRQEKEGLREKGAEKAERGEARRKRNLKTGWEGGAAAAVFLLCANEIFECGELKGTKRERR